jgi:cell division protein FtsW (lipid II flippase)
MGMVMGLLPVVGIPLAFFSYGGSYMLLNFFLCGLFMSVLNDEELHGRLR